jgi:hypothetical protein
MRDNPLIDVGPHFDHMDVAVTVRTLRGLQYSVRGVAVALGAALTAVHLGAAFAGPQPRWARKVSQFCEWLDTPLLSSLKRGWGE